MTDRHFLLSCWQEDMCVGVKRCVGFLWMWVCVHVFECVCVILKCYTERKGENVYLMSYLPQKLFVLMITWPLTLTLAIARRRHEVKYLPFWLLLSAHQKLMLPGGLILFPLICFCKTLLHANHITIRCCLVLMAPAVWALVFPGNSNIICIFQPWVKSMSWPLEVWTIEIHILHWSLGSGPNIVGWQGVVRKNLWSTA